MSNVEGSARAGGAGEEPQPRTRERERPGQDPEPFDLDPQIEPADAAAVNGQPDDAQGSEAAAAPADLDPDRGNTLIQPDNS